MVLTILILTCGYAVKFAIRGKRQFFQLNFDWKKEQNIQDLGKVFVDSLSYNYVSLDVATERFNPESTYKLTKDNDIFYFRYVYATQSELGSQFRGVEWVTDVPSRKHTHYFLEEVELPLKTSGPSIITIGDEFTFENEGKYLRKDILSQYTAHFKGAHTDVFNLKYVGGKKNKAADILQVVSSLEPADFYIVFFGQHETDLTAFEGNAFQILEALSSKNPKQIFWIMLPPVRDDSLKTHYSQMNTIIEKFTTHPKTDVIVTSELFSDSIPKFIREDGVSISRDGYYRIAKRAAKKMKNAN